MLQLKNLRLVMVDTVHIRYSQCSSKQYDGLQSETSASVSCIHLQSVKNIYLSLKVAALKCPCQRTHLKLKYSVCSKQVRI